MVDAKIYTTGQVAKLIKVSARTVTKWFDQGKLKGYRIPGSLDRRIPHKELLDFLRRSNIESTTFGLEERTTTLLITSDSIIAQQVKNMLPGFAITVTNDAFQIGMLLGSQPPSLILVHCDSVPMGMLTKLQECKTCNVILLVGDKRISRGLGAASVKVPLDPNVLKATVNNILKEAQAV